MKLHNLCIPLLLIFLVGCASIPAGWEESDNGLVQTETGLTFPQQTDSMKLINVTGVDSYNQSDALHYETNDAGVRVSIYLRKSDDISFKDYSGYSKAAIVKENGLQSQLTPETITIKHQGKTYPAETFRGYGRVVEMDEHAFTILHSFYIFDFGKYYLKVRSTAGHELVLKKTLASIIQYETEILRAVYDTVE